MMSSSWCLLCLSTRGSSSESKASCKLDGAMLFPKLGSIADFQVDLYALALHHERNNLN
jgi:hypothetical protein